MSIRTISFRGVLLAVLLYGSIALEMQQTLQTESAHNVNQADKLFVAGMAETKELIAEVSETSKAPVEKEDVVQEKTPVLGGKRLPKNRTSL